MKKIVFINSRQTYPYYQWWDWISLNLYLKNLKKDWFDVLSVWAYNPPHIQSTKSDVINTLRCNNIFDLTETSTWIKYKTDSWYNNTMIDFKCFSQEIASIVETEKPDIIMTQLNNSHIVIDIAKEFKSKVIHLVHDVDNLNLLSLNKSQDISHVFFNSRFSQERFKEYVKCQYSILYPPLDEEYELFIQDKSVEKKYVTMINPVHHKWSQILLNLIKNNPNIEFLLVKNWQEPEPEFQEHNNVTIIPRQWDIIGIYKKTKILLVPSQWEEAFWRVCAEAIACWTPVIASNTWWIPEAVWNCWILIENFSDPSEWNTVLNRLGSRVV